MLVMFSGLPASGKSALADQLGRRLPAAVLSVDPIEAAICRCGITQSFETGVAAYEVAAVLAETSGRNGRRSALCSTPLTPSATTSSVPLRMSGSDRAGIADSP